MKWELKLERLVEQLSEDNNHPKMVDANSNMIRRTLTGLGPDEDDSDTDRSLNVVVNTSAAHIPAFCKASKNNEEKPYKNSYDLGKTRRIGDYPDADHLPRRVKVDAAVEAVTSIDQDSIYFAATELNGCGIRFYGDLCLVLSDQVIDEHLHILETNSYDIIREPRHDGSHPIKESSLVSSLKDMHGQGPDEWVQMATIKVLEIRGKTSRRLTTGQISDAILEDEDYIEVLLSKSFGAGDVREVRTTAGDIARQGQIQRDAVLGPTPALAELEWRNQRRSAFDALNKMNVTYRTVTQQGRVKA